MPVARPGRSASRARRNARFRSTEIGRAAPVRIVAGSRAPPWWFRRRNVGIDFGAAIGRAERARGWLSAQNIVWVWAQAQIAELERRLLAKGRNAKLTWSLPARILEPERAADRLVRFEPVENAGGTAGRTLHARPRPEDLGGGVAAPRAASRGPPRSPASWRALAKPCGAIDGQGARAPARARGAACRRPDSDFDLARAGIA